MSVLNQVLRDLDERRATHETKTLPRVIRPLPQKKGSHLMRWLLSGGAILFIAVVLAYFFSPFFLKEQAPIVETPIVLPPLSKEIPSESLPALEKKEELPLQLSDEISLDLKPPVLKKEALPKKEPEKKRVLENSDKASFKKETKPEKTAVIHEKPEPAAKNTVKTGRIEKSDPNTSPKDRAQNEYRKALQSANQGRVEEAITLLRTALQADGTHTASRQLLVNLLIEAKRSSEAIDTLQDGVRHQPSQVSWVMSLARLELELGKIEEAWKTLENSMPIGGKNAAYQGFAGHVLQRMKRYREAGAHFLEAAKLAPQDGRWWLGLGLAYDAEGMVNEAKEAFLRARQTANLTPDLYALIDQKLK